MTESYRTKFVETSSPHGVRSIHLENSTRLDDVRGAAASLEAMAAGERPQGQAVYGRLHNDTVAAFEDSLAAVEGTCAAVAFASGMAAMTAVLLAARELGDHVVAVRPLYGGTDHLLSAELTGLGVRWARQDQVAELIDDTTALVLAETPANPTLTLVDIERLVGAAGEVPVLIDSTFATPVLQNPAEFGAGLVLHSASKYIGGHGDVIGGVVATDEAWARRLRQVRLATGGILHPMAGYLLRRGLATLPARVERAQATAGELARRLVAHQGVDRVFYPGLKSCDPELIVDRQMRGPGAMIAFEVDDADVGRAVMESVQVITPAVSLGSTDTLLQHPASLTHQVVDEQSRREGGISPGLLRLSVGLEDVEDLWVDLDQALQRSRRARTDRAPLRAIEAPGSRAPAQVDDAPRGPNPNFSASP